MKRTRSGHGPPCPNFFSPCSLDWQHNSCLPTCFIPDIDDVCSAGRSPVPPSPARQCPSVRPSVRQSLGLAVCCHVGFIDGVCVEGGGGNFAVARSTSIMNSLARNAIPTTQDALLRKVLSFSPVTTWDTFFSKMGRVRASNNSP